MRKIASWFLIIISGLSLFLVLMTLLTFTLDEESMGECSNVELWAVILFFIFIAVLCVLGIVVGIRLLRKKPQTNSNTLAEEEETGTFDDIIVFNHKLGKIVPPSPSTKLKGIAIVLASSFFLLMLSFSLLFVLTGFATGNLSGINADNLWGLPFMLIPIMFFGYGLKHGISLIKTERRPSKVAFTQTMNINFKGRISYEEYKAYYIKAAMGNSWYLVALGLFFGFMFWGFFRDGIEQYELIILCIVALAVYWIVRQFFRIRQTYDSAKILNEEVEYFITNDSIRLLSETIDADLKWDMFISVKETKDFILLYQNAYIATFIPKKMFNETDFITFRHFLRYLVSVG